jgi:dipeptidyl aminopeptidase/acylaminoacyl peptidase
MIKDGLLMMAQRINFRLVCMMLLVSIGTGCDSKSDSNSKTRSAATSAQSQKLTTVSDAFTGKYKKQTSLDQSHGNTVEISQGGRGYAYIESVGEKSRVVHNGVAGKVYAMVGDLTLSADGRRVAHVASDDNKFFKMVVDGHGGPLFMDLGMPRFTPDGKHVIYTSTEQDRSYLLIDHKPYYDYNVTRYCLISPDSRWLAFAGKRGQDSKSNLVIADMELKDAQLFEGCGEPYVVSNDKSRIATVCRDGEKIQIKVIDFNDRKLVSTSRPYTGVDIAGLKFAPDDRSLAYTIRSGNDGARRYIAYNDKEEQIPDGEEIMSDPFVFAGDGGVGAIVGTATTVRLYRAFTAVNKEGPKFGYISDMAVSRDMKHYAYAAFDPGGENLQHIVIDGYSGPKFDKIVEPLFSPDGLLLSYRARQNGKRFLVISDLNGRIIKKHKEYDMVFKPVFSDNGSSVAYGVLDGNELWWKVEKL